MSFISAPNWCRSEYRYQFSTDNNRGKKVPAIKILQGPWNQTYLYFFIKFSFEGKKCWPLFSCWFSTSKSNKQKKLFFVASLKVTDEKSRFQSGIRSWSRIWILSSINPRIRIRAKMSRIRNTYYRYPLTTSPRLSCFATHLSPNPPISPKSSATPSFVYLHLRDLIQENTVLIIR